MFSKRYNHINIMFIRMLSALLWCMVVLSARCSGSDETPLERAVQSSTGNSINHVIASQAIDGNLTTYSLTSKDDPAWLRVYFQSSFIVDKVVIERGYSYDAACVLTVSVYDGETETVCGTYTGNIANT